MTPDAVSMTYEIAVARLTAFGYAKAVPSSMDMKSAFRALSMDVSRRVIREFARLHDLRLADV